MAIRDFTLKSKKNLNDNVYELIYEVDWLDKMKNWQFVTFLIDKIWGRAYSILEQWENYIKLIIRKWELNESWRWWSKYLCEQNIWEKLKWVWVSGHFLLKENNKNKIFIWTWTWIVPLINQINWSILLKQNSKLKLIFWVRYIKDFFYLDEIKKLKENYKNFDFILFSSKEEETWINKWYVYDYLNYENIKDYEEFYICWNEKMLNSSIEKLKYLNVNETNIFYEKY